MTAKKPKRPGRRGVTPGSLTQVVVAAKRDYEQAKARFESVAAVVGSHTLWEHEDGRDLCDHDGDTWPCSTVIGFAFVYGVAIPEQWERSAAAASSPAVSS
jgi:hypothetical protein